MKILLCGEGAHDMGVIEPWSIKTDKQEIKPGWLQVLLQKILGDEQEFILVPRSRLVSLPGAKVPAGGYPPGHGRKAMAAKFRGHTDGCDLVVFMVDADTPDISEWKAKCEQIVSGFNHIKQEIKAVACVPMSASESWLMADGTAWADLGLADVQTLPSKPETIWGKRADPDANHPHQYFSRMCQKIGVDDAREVRVEVMARSELATLQARCPNSFSPFMSEVGG